uniref:uncharacterized protein LOC109965354 n=1 Tax=Monopterus albus TaxID=43700 RepID=UPI0009B4931F|nr:uncharacterized protein LOC109965354 [Monopterus albus]
MYTFSLPGNRKQDLDDCFVNFIFKDSQPFSVVEDVGFKELVAKLDPTYALPTRKALKNMVVAKYEEEREKAKAEIQGVETVSLTADMWTSINMDSYLAVTCHFVNKNDQLSTHLLGTRNFPRTHTAAHIAAEIKSPAPAAASTGVDLWRLLDHEAHRARHMQSATANAIVEVNRYLADPPLERTDDALTYWATHNTVYPNLYELSKHFLFIPASSMPCERVFSKPGEIVLSGAEDEMTSSSPW